MTPCCLDQAGEHQRQRPGGRETGRSTRAHLDHHTLLPGREGGNNYQYVQMPRLVLQIEKRRVIVFALQRRPIFRFN